ncbi:hypothetical protein OPKNFCMD_3431 [Methylobacterium crusticola]|uniref:Response regulatory domain-containing protein n=1 Tax=Methylobacterium crusticola TaxID=1697972 RepID=A0ABQ4QZ74_9HYPH|nr:response regulator [Methylobacterium crusticola]GJD50686.1 hypothetical protein OPKNFCMD_3431 [Methylobacterium crusticola]
MGAGPRNRGGTLTPTLSLDAIGEALAATYDDLVAEGVPEHLAGLVRRVEARAAALDVRPARIALVVEDDPAQRALAEMILDESELAVIGCDSAEAALAVLRERSGEVALVFADLRLAGEMDGAELVKAVATLWPTTHMVLTSGALPPGDLRLPPEAVFIRKPWRALDVLVAAERAVLKPPPPVA